MYRRLKLSLDALLSILTSLELSDCYFWPSRFLWVCLAISRGPQLARSCPTSFWRSFNSPTVNFQTRTQDLLCYGPSTIIFRGLFLQGPETLYLRNAEAVGHQTLQSSWFFLNQKHVEKSAFQNKRIAVWQLAFQARKVLGTFEKQAPVSPGRVEIKEIAVILFMMLKKRKVLNLTQLDRGFLILVCEFLSIYPFNILPGFSFNKCWVDAW